jgi:hypothetical protein
MDYGAPGLGPIGSVRPPALCQGRGPFSKVGPGVLPCWGVPTNVSDKGRESRRRRHDQLSRKPTKSQHQTRARADGVMEATDRAHNDAGAFGYGFDGDIRKALAEIGDEMHAQIGHRDIEPIRSTAHQCLGQRVALLTIELPHATNVGGEMTLLHEFGDDRLLQCRWLSIDEVAGAHKGAQQRVRHHGVADAQAWEQSLVECANVNHLLAVIQPLERCKRRSGIAELAGVVVLDDERSASVRPF